MKKIIKMITIISIVLIITWASCEIPNVKIKTLTAKNKMLSANVTTSSIGVTLKENGEVVSSANNGEETSTTPLLRKMLIGDEKFEIGKKYNEQFSAYNSGKIDTYVRIIITKNWLDNNNNNNTVTDLSPESIELNILENNGWFADENACTPERSVVYYKKILPAGESTPNVTQYLRINSDVYNNYNVVNNNGNIIVENKYNGYSFYLDVEVDAIQTHNAVDAIKSKWGVNVNINSDGTLELL